MRVWEFTDAASGGMQQAERDRPIPKDGELLVKIDAAGIIPTERLWYTSTRDRAGAARIGAVPSHEFSGVIVAIGDGVEGFDVDRAVFGMNDWFADGALAEYCITTPAQIALKPATLSSVQAASIPISALTAWQGLFKHADLRAGQRVLVHGAAGAVGLYAVQFAALHGAEVVTTASGKDAALLTQLGATQVIDYHSTDFTTAVAPVDLVFDTVGGDTLARSWQVLQPGGRVFSAAADAETSADPKIKSAFFLVEADGRQMSEIAELISQNKVRTFVKQVVAFADAGWVYEPMHARAETPGKVIVEL